MNEDEIIQMLKERGIELYSICYIFGETEDDITVLIDATVMIKKNVIYNG